MVEARVEQLQAKYMEESGQEPKRGIQKERKTLEEHKYDFPDWPEKEEMMKEFLGLPRDRELMQRERFYLGNKKWNNNYHIWMKLCQKDYIDLPGLKTDYDYCQNLWKNKEVKDIAKDFREEHIEGWETPWMKSLDEIVNPDTKLSSPHSVYTTKGMPDYLISSNPYSGPLFEETEPLSAIEQEKEVNKQFDQRIEELTENPTKKLSKSIVEDGLIDEDVEWIVNFEKHIWDKFWKAFDRNTAGERIPAWSYSAVKNQLWNKHWSILDDIYKTSDDMREVTKKLVKEKKDFFNSDSLGEISPNASELFNIIEEEMERVAILQTNKRRHGEWLEKGNEFEEELKDETIYRRPSDKNQIEDLSDTGFQGKIKESIQEFEEHIENMARYTHPVSSSYISKKTGERKKKEKESSCNLPVVAKHTEDARRVISKDMYRGVFHDLKSMVGSFKKEIKNSIDDNKRVSDIEIEHRAFNRLKDKTGISKQTYQWIDNKMKEMKKISDRVKQEFNDNCICKVSRDPFFISKWNKREDILALNEIDYDNVAEEIRESPEEYETLLDTVKKKIEKRGDTPPEDKKGLANEIEKNPEQYETIIRLFWNDEDVMNVAEITEGDIRRGLLNTYGLEYSEENKLDLIDTLNNKARTIHDALEKIGTRDEIARRIEGKEEDTSTIIDLNEDELFALSKFSDLDQKEVIDRFKGKIHSNILPKVKRKATDILKHYRKPLESQSEEERDSDEFIFRGGTDAEDAVNELEMQYGKLYNEKMLRVKGMLERKLDKIGTLSRTSALERVPTGKLIEQIELQKDSVNQMVISSDESKDWETIWKSLDNLKRYVYEHAKDIGSAEDRDRPDLANAIYNCSPSDFIDATANVTDACGIDYMKWGPLGGETVDKNKWDETFYEPNEPTKGQEFRYWTPYKAKGEPAKIQRAKFTIGETYRTENRRAEIEKGITTAGLCRRDTRVMEQARSLFDANCSCSIRMKMDKDADEDDVEVSDSFIKQQKKAKRNITV